MAQYTIQMRQLTVEQGWTDERLGLTQYPIFDEQYRPHLNKLIRDYYAFEEIGFETPARFAQRLGVRMMMEMPYFNKMYQVIMADYDPMSNINVSYVSLTDLVRHLTDTDDTTGKHTKTGTDSTATKTGETGTDTSNKNGTDTLVTDATSTTTNTGSDIDKTVTDTTGTQKQTVDVTGSNTNKHLGDDTTTITYTSATTQTGSVDHTGTSDLSRGGTETNIRTGSQTREPNLSDVDNVRHLHSDTPDAMVTYDELTQNNYVSSADMERHNMSHTGTETTTFNSVQDQTTYQGRNDKRTDDLHDTYNNVKNAKSGMDTNKNMYNSQTELTASSNETLDNTTGEKTTGETTHTLNNSSTVKTDATDTRTVADTTTGSYSKNTDGSHIITYDNILDDVVKRVLERAQTDKTNQTWTEKGYRGVTPAEIIMQWRDAMVSIDKLVLESLASLFMCIL